MKKPHVIIALTLLIGLAAFKSQPAALFVAPKGWPKPAYNSKKHPLSKEKIALGRLLFYDPVLSSDSTISCASCHSSYTAFTHIDHSLSHGIEGKIGTRNSLALINLAWSKTFMWDGAVDDLDVQAKNPITNKLEMNESMEHVVYKLQSSHRYPALFYNAFGDSVITADEVLKSLSQFMLTLVSANAKYDRVQRGEEKFTDKEAHGYKLFQKNCESCHQEPLFTNDKFENNGLTIDPALNDIGRMKITHQRKDSLRFKVPTLRNIELTAPYMHDGRFKTLNLVLNNYIRGIQHGPTLSPQLEKGVYFTPEEKVDVIAFLLTLTDKEFVSNPNFAYPKQ